MGKQSFFILALCGIILYNAASIVKQIFFKHFSSSLIRSTSLPERIHGSTCSSKFLSTYCEGPFSDVKMDEGLALGRKRDNEAFLSIGIMPTGDHGGNNLIQAVRSLTVNLKPTEYPEVVIVAALEEGLHEVIMKRLGKDLESEIKHGLFQVIFATNAFFKKEPLEWENTSFTDDFKEKIFNFNWRLSFLLQYCFQISKYFLLLTDESRAVKPYFPLIKQVVGNIEEQGLFNHDFGAHAFPGLGRLYPKKVIGDLAEFGAMFSDGRLPGELLDTFNFMRGNMKASRQPPESVLFDMATELQGVKPIAEIHTTAEFVRGYELEKSFYDMESFSWLKVPKVDHKLAIVFTNPLYISRVRIATGSPLYRDTLSDSILLACGNTAGTNNCDESKCTEIGDFRDPILDLMLSRNELDFPVKCLRIVFMADAKHWVIIREISVWSLE